MTAIKKRFEELKQMLSDKGKLIHANTILQRASRLWPNRTALICENDSATFAQLYEQSVAVSTYLVDHGVTPGDRVIILYENSINFYIAYFGAWQAGAIIVPLNVYLHERELEHVIADAQPKALIASPTQQKKFASCSNLPTVYGEELFTPTAEPQNDSSAWNIPKQDTHDCTVILYTSGTTGLPKGVMLSSNNIMTSCMQGIANFNVRHNEKILASLPLFHSYMQNTAIWSPFVAGAGVIIVPTISRAALLQALKHNPTVVLGIPQLFGLFCLMKTAPFKNVALFASGGDALHNKICMGFELIYNRKIANGYGLTETAPFLTMNLDPGRQPMGCVGKPVVGVEVEVRDATNKKLAPYNKGILWARGNNIMLGYYNAPEATAQVLQDGWFNTGDLAYIDKHGCVILCGREKDLIIHKGFNIYPQEIENILTSHPAVFMASVVGQQVDGNEIPIAFVASKDAPENLSQELKELCAKNLAAYKVPHHFYIKSELPTTATGKVDKKQLKKELNSVES